jgi:O-antigen/teichoic acid export membrane protein
VKSRLKQAFFTRGSTVVVQLVDMAAQVLVGIFVARYLGPEMLGHLTVALTVAGLLSIFVLFGAGDVCLQWHAKGEVPGKHILGVTLLMWMFGSAAVLLVGMLLGLALGLYGAALGVLFLALFALAGNGLASVFNHPIVAANRSAEDLPGVLFSRAVMLFGVVAASFWGSLEGVVGALALGALLLAQGRARLVRKKFFRPEVGWDGVLFSRLWRRGRKIGFGSIFGTISARADVLMLQTMTSPVQVGFYGAAYRVINGITALSNALAVALFPDLARARAAGKRGHFFLAVALGLGFCALAFIPLGPLFLTAVFGEAFAPAATTFQILLVAAALQTLLIFYSKGVVAGGRERDLPPAQACGAVVNIGLNLLLIPLLGIEGAAWATVFADCTTLFLLRLPLSRWGWERLRWPIAFGARS